MRTNKFTAVFVFLSVILFILSFMSIRVYNGIKEMIILRDTEIIDKLQIVVGDIKDDITVENVAKLKSYSQKIMNMDGSFYKDNNNNSSGYSIVLSNLSSDILKNIDDEELLIELLSEYENILDIISNNTN